MHNMRTPLLATVLGLMLPACLVGSGDITGGGDDVSATCGNGTVDTGEACDDGNTTSGDGCSATCQTENVSTPRVTATVDKPTLTTELKTSNRIAVTVAGSGGFSGAVTLAASVVDANNVALAGWTVALDSSTLDLPANGTATANATLTIPSQAMALAGTVKVDVTSSLGAQSVTSAVTALNQVTFAIHVDTTSGLCVFPTNMGHTANPDAITIGTKVRWFNDAAVGAPNFEIHMGGSPTPVSTFGFSHQGQSPGGLADPTTEPGTAYEQTATAASGAEQITWYCHLPDSGSGTPGELLTVQ